MASLKAHPIRYFFLASVTALLIGLAALFETMSAEAAPSFRLAKVRAGFSDPTWVGAPRGDSRLFVVEREGRVRVRAAGKWRTFLDLRSRVNAGGGEQGLLSIEFHPKFASNGRYFVYYTRGDGNGVVAELRSRGNGTVAGSFRQLLVVPLISGTSNHNGGMLRFGPNDGLLYIGTGDGGGAGDPQNSGQDLSVLRGKLLRIGVDGKRPYTIPASNPFVNRSGARDEIFAFGLRNPWRFSFDRPTGDLFIGDVGQGEREEIDRLVGGRPAGANFGWGRFEGTMLFNSDVRLASGTSHTPPVFQYSHARGCSVTGGFVYRGTKISSLRGYYVYGDFCSNEIRGFRGSGRNAFRKTVSFGSIVSFGEGGDGTLYVASLDGGTIWRIAP